MLSYQTHPTCFTQVGFTAFWNKTLHFKLADFNLLLCTAEINPSERAVKWVLHYFLYFLSVWFLMCFFSCPIFLFFERTKTWQYLCLSMSFANYADCFTLRFVFNVRLMILWYIYIFENKYIYTFNFNNLLKMNTFNVIFGID